MSDSPVDRIRELSDAVGESESIDWELEVLRARDADDVRVIRNLRVIAEVAAANEVCAIEAPTDLPFLKWGHLRLESRLGSGSQGEVYLARDERLGHEVALKILDSDSMDFVLRNQLLEEARRLAQIRHENVVRVLGADIDHGRIGFWMEYVRGHNLAALLNLQGPMSATEATVYGLVLSRALGAAHNAGVIHGDVKPTNVIREVGGRICLVDFGAGLSSMASQSIQHSIVRGTPLFMAPEMILQGKLDARSDIYALGALLFHLVTLRYPIEGSHLESIAAAHKQGIRPDLGTMRSDIPIAFRRVVERCLRPNPEDRFQNARDLESALDESVALSTSRSFSRRSRTTAAVGLAGLLIGIGATWFFSRPEAQVLEARGYRSAAVSLAPASRDRVATLEGYAEVLAFVGGKMSLTVHGCADSCPPVLVERPAEEPNSMLSARVSCQDRIAAGQARQYTAVAWDNRANARRVVLRVVVGP